MSVLIRAALGEFPATVLDLTTLGVEVLSPRRLPVNERVGLTLRSAAAPGPGVSISGDVRVCREESGASYHVSISLIHTPVSEKHVQAFLWKLEEGRGKDRGR